MAADTKTVKVPSGLSVDQEVCVCADNLTKSRGMLIDFGDPMRPVMH